MVRAIVAGMLMAGVGLSLPVAAFAETGEQSARATRHVGDVDMSDDSTGHVSAGSTVPPSPDAVVGGALSALGGRRGGTVSVFGAVVVVVLLGVAVMTTRYRR